MVKGGAFYDCLTRVPLVVSWPGRIGKGVRIDNPVNLIDVLPTLLHLQEMAAPDWMQGRLLPGVSDSSGAEATFSEYGAGGPRFTLDDLAGAPKPWGYRTVIQSLQWREAEGRRAMIRTRNWKYVRDPMGDIDELYDLRSDPWELENKAGDPSYADVQHRLAIMLADFAISTEDPVPVRLPPAELRLQ